MRDALLTLSALFSMTAFAIHTFVGTRYAVGPLLLATGVPVATRWLNYLCWHMATLFTFLMTVFLFRAAAGHGSRDVVAFLAIMAAGSSILSAVAAVRAGLHPFRFPATYLLGGVAASGAMALAAG